METSPSTNNSQGILIALVVISLLASLATMGFLVRERNQNASVQRELLTTLAALRSAPTPDTQAPSAPVNTPPPAANPGRQPVPPSQNDDWMVTVHEGVSISYPKNLSVTTYEDEFFSGQRNLRISSSATRRVGIDSTNFQGYELVMRKIDAQQFLDHRKETTLNPNVSSIVELCDGETCPDAQYLFTKNGERYLIEALYQMAPYQTGVELNDRIIASIR